MALELEVPESVPLHSMHKNAIPNIPKLVCDKEPTPISDILRTMNNKSALDLLTLRYIWRKTKALETIIAMAHNTTATSNVTTYVIESPE